MEGRKEKAMKRQIPVIRWHGEIRKKGNVGKVAEHGRQMEHDFASLGSWKKKKHTCRIERWQAEGTRHGSVFASVGVDIIAGVCMEMTRYRIIDRAVKAKAGHA